MRYEEPARLSVAQIEDAMAGNDIDRACSAIIGASLYLQDWRLSQGICLKAIGMDDKDLKRCGLIGLGHVVRIHGEVDVNLLKLAIDRFDLRNDADLSGYVDNLMDDVAIFLARDAYFS